MKVEGLRFVVGTIVSVLLAFGLWKLFGHTDLFQRYRLEIVILWLLVLGPIACLVPFVVGEAWLVLLSFVGIVGVILLQRYWEAAIWTEDLLFFWAFAAWLCGMVVQTVSYGIGVVICNIRGHETHLDESLEHQRIAMCVLTVVLLLVFLVLSAAV